MSLFEQLYNVLSPYLEARTRIRIRFKVKGRIRIQGPYLHQTTNKQDPDPDPHQSDTDPQHWWKSCGIVFILHKYEIRPFQKEFGP
jgi:hypothetical protein